MNYDQQSIDMYELKLITTNVPPIPNINQVYDSTVN